MADLYELILIDGPTRWVAGWLVDEETDGLLTADDDRVLVFPGRPGLEHYAQQRGLTLLDDQPDEVDLDLGGWLERGAPEPPAAEVSELWHLLLDHPTAGRPLEGEEIEESYDDLVEEEPDWFAVHGEFARKALAASVRQLRRCLSPQGT